MITFMLYCIYLKLNYFILYGNLWLCYIIIIGSNLFHFKKNDEREPIKGFYLYLLNIEINSLHFFVVKKWFISFLVFFKDNY